ncbi:MAG: hypothetical protein IT458_03920 [Planctomycetes bacterium]|nr:hypothetical protein [Planctomycetota bacterium]
MSAPRTLLRATLLLLAPALAGQGFVQNKLEFGNFWIVDREELFPNYLRAGGNVAGDALFKVLPAEVLERHGDHRISGYKVALSVDDAYTGGFSPPVLVRVPALQLCRTRVHSVAGQTYEVPDLARPVGPRFEPLQILLPSDNAWVVEVAFDPSASDPKLRGLLTVPALDQGQRAGLGLVFLAEVGQKRDPNTPGVVLQSTFQERHLAPGRPAYSGSYDAATGTLRMYGQSGQPSATGELCAALRFEDPTLQIYGSSAGGVANDPQGFETHLGPGAYATDLASAAGASFFGFYVQAQRHHVSGQPPTHVALPLVVSTAPGGPNTSLDLGNGAVLRIDPASLGLADLFVAAGLGGAITRYAKAGVAGWDEDQEGVYATPRIPLRANPSLVGVTLWVQGLVLTSGMAPAATTNVTRWTLR